MTRTLVYRRVEHVRLVQHVDIGTDHTDVLHDNVRAGGVRSKVIVLAVEHKRPNGVLAIKVVDEVVRRDQGGVEWGPTTRPARRRCTILGDWTTS